MLVRTFRIIASKVNLLDSVSSLTAFIRPCYDMITNRMYLIIVLLLLIIFAEGINNYIPEIKHVSRKYSVAALL
jgi:hypothetical protein